MVLVSRAGDEETAGLATLIDLFGNKVQYRRRT